jgi:Flp pilus assembly protein TadD
MADKKSDKHAAKKTAKTDKNRRLGRKESRDLDIEIGFLEGLVRRDPDYVDALKLLGDDYSRRGRVHEGLHVDRRLKSLRPGDPEVLFNLACSLVASGDPEGASAELLRAIDAGYRDFRWLRSDPDLAVLRRHPSFRAVRAAMKAAQAAKD